MAHNAVLALGIMGAGTNNARLAGMLRSLSSYYGKEPNLLFMVRIAQGLVHMGKGLMSLSPYHTDRQLLSPVALSGLVSLLYCALDVKVNPPPPPPSSSASPRPPSPNAADQPAALCSPISPPPLYRRTVPTPRAHRGQLF